MSLIALLILLLLFCVLVWAARTLMGALASEIRSRASCTWFSC